MKEIILKNKVFKQYINRDEIICIIEDISKKKLINPKYKIHIFYDFRWFIYFTAI